MKFSPVFESHGSEIIHKHNFVITEFLLGHKNKQRTFCPVTTWRKDPMAESTYPFSITASIW